MIRSFLMQNPCVDCGESDPIVLDFDHVRGDPEHAKAKPMAQQISGGGLAVVLGWAVVVSAAAAWGLGDARPVLAGLLGLAGMTVWCGRWFRDRLGGFTGDTLGASQQLGELAALLGWLAVRHG